MDDLLKEGYNILKHSGEYGQRQLRLGAVEETLAESAVRLFLGESGEIYKYFERRLENDEGF